MSSHRDSNAVGGLPDRILRHGLAKKLAAFAFVSAFVTSLTVTWAAIDSTQQSLNKIIHRQIPASLRRIAYRQNRWVRAGEQHLSALGSNLIEQRARRHAPRSESIRRAQDASDAPTRALGAVEGDLFSALFSRWVESSPHFRGIAILGPDGEALLTRGAFDRGAFDASAEESESLRAAPASNRQFAVAPLLSTFPSGTRLVGDFAPFAFDRALAEEAPLPGATLGVFDPRAPSQGVEALARFSGSNSSRVREYTNERDEHVIGCVMPLGLFGWQIAVEVPFDVAFEPVMSAATRMLAIELCIVLLFSFVAYRITKVMLRPIEELSDGARLIAAGVIDHEIVETGSDDEVGLLARSFNQMMRILRRDRQEVEEAHRELMEKNLDLQRANEVLNQLSITDGLTKIHNHRFFQDHLTREIKRVNRLNEPLAIILIDVDDFKSLNDRFGHAAGDEILARLARIMEDSVRETDLLARYGGEEFVIVASNTDALGAYQLAEKIRINIGETSFTIGDAQRTMRITVSIGVAQYDGNRKKFFLAADRALYNAKGEGKNCVIVD